MKLYVGWALPGIWLEEIEQPNHVPKTIYAIYQLKAQEIEQGLWAEIIKSP